MAYFINDLEVSEAAYKAWIASDKKGGGGATPTPTTTPTNDSEPGSQTDTQTGSGAASAATPTPTDDSTPESQADAQTEPEASLTPEESEAMAMAQKLGFERAQAEIDKLVEQDPFYALFTWDVSVNTTIGYQTINDFDDIAPEYRPGLAELEWEQYNSYAGVPTDYRDDLILREMEEKDADEDDKTLSEEGYPSTTDYTNDEEEPEDDLSEEEEIVYSNVSEEERAEILQRMKDSDIGYPEDSEAVAFLEMMLYDERTKDMTLDELMTQYAMQFNGDKYYDEDGNELIPGTREYDDYEVNKVAELDLFEEEFHLAYENGDGFNDDSFDTYNDCSGFVQELYDIFYGQGLMYTSGDYVTSGYPQAQFETFRNNGRGQNGDVKYFKAAPKRYKALEMDESEVMNGDVIYYNKSHWIDHDDDPKTPKVINYKKTDHVVMSLGNGWVIEAKGKAFGVVISKINTNKIVGYSMHYPEYLEGGNEE